MNAIGTDVDGGIGVSESNISYAIRILANNATANIMDGSMWYDVFNILII